MTERGSKTAGLPLVGRERELAALDAVLATAAGGSPAVVAVVGEPGIGKTTLLARLAEAATARGARVLTGRAAEFEREIPFGLFVDAIEPYLRSLDPARLRRLAPAHLAELATVFPSLAAYADMRAGASGRERYRLHRAVRGLLEHLALGAGLALLLDDLHWADPASAELVASLVRRPPSAGVAIAVAFRTNQVERPLSTVLDRAAADGLALRIVLGPLTGEQSAALLPGALPAATRRALHEESGGNPFYLEQLARLHRNGHRAHARVAAADRLGGVPEAVAVALAEEVAPLSADARRLLQGAAVSGEPFEADFAAAVADLPGARALVALDELLHAELLHGTETPRWFRFRHPLVRRAVYESAKTGWRLAAHARAADRLRAQAAGAASQAHHVEQSATVGDRAAIDLLVRAADEVAPRAPATAAQWLEAALRLVPEDGPGSVRRGELLGRLALALVAAGRFDEGRTRVLEALALCPPSSPARVELIAGCAAIERLLGRFDDARTRLAAALADVPDPRSPAAVALRLELTAHASLSADFDLMRDCAASARDDARTLGDAVAVAAATAALSFAEYSVGRFAEAGERCRDAAALVAMLDDATLGTRLETLIYLGWAEWFMGRFEPAGRQFGRGVEVSRLSGRAALVIELMVGKTLALSGCGRMAEALDLADAAVEEARLMGNDHTLVWALFALCTALEPAADSASAVRAGEEAVAAARGFEGSTIAAGCGWALASALVAAGQGERAIAVMLEWQGGEELPWFFPGHRAACYEVLTRAALLAGRHGDARRWAQRARDAADRALPFACAMADRAEAEVLLAAAEPHAAAELALASATTTAALGATVESARARLLAGRALAAAGDRDAAAEHLRDAEAALLACGAKRLQADVVRELRRIGRRVNRRGRGGRADSAGAAALSPREREVAGLAAAGHTNREIAVELVLSDKTIESHLASVFVKLGVDARGAVEEALRAGEA